MVLASCVADVADSDLKTQNQPNPPKHTLDKTCIHVYDTKLPDELLEAKRLDIFEDLQISEEEKSVV